MRGKMRLAIINMLHVGSTGKIMLSLAEIARDNGITTFTYAPYPLSKRKEKKPIVNAYHFFYGTWIERRISNIIGRLFGLNGLTYLFGTVQLIHDLKKKKIDTVHLHNMHSFCICLPLLFHYTNKHNISVIWTLHDCWVMTGHCPHFDMIKCNKWITGCNSCSQYKDYPSSYVDNSKFTWKWKRRLFTNIKELMLVTPSQWLASKVYLSYLQKAPIKVINNGIDLSIFFPMSRDFFEDKYGIKGKTILLGVAFDWGVRKGLDIFLELSHKLDADNFQIVLVGTNDVVDKQLPTNIISIHRTLDQYELAKIYSAADIYINPTREENFPTVNMEAIACGTPVITFDTGGCKETIGEGTGIIVRNNTIDDIISSITKILDNIEQYRNKCHEFRGKLDQNHKYHEYLDLYFMMKKNNAGVENESS